MIGVLTATCFLLALAVVLYFWGNKTAFNFIKMFLIFAILLDFIGLSGKATLFICGGLFALVVFKAFVHDQTAN